MAVPDRPADGRRTTLRPAAQDPSLPPLRSRRPLDRVRECVRLLHYTGEPKRCLRALVQGVRAHSWAATPGAGWCVGEGRLHT